MGSRMNASRSPAFQQPEDEIPEPTPAAGSATRSLLHRIANTLQVPPSALVEPLNQVKPARGTSDEAAVDAVVLASECLELIRVYRGISDPVKRHRLLELIRHEAEQG